MNKKAAYKPIILIFLLLSLFSFHSVPLLADANKEAKDFNFGRELFKQQLFDPAIRQFEEFLSKYPNSDFAPSARYLRAWSQEKLKNWKKALQSYEDYLERYPTRKNAPDALAGKARVLVVLKDFEGALKSYEEIIREYPNHTLVPFAQIGYARILLKKKEYSKAADFFSQLYERAPAGPFASNAAYYFSYALEKAGNYPKSIDAYRVVIERFSDSDVAQQARFRIGEIYSELAEESKDSKKSLENYQKAVAAYSEVLSEKSKAYVPDALYGRAWANWKRGKMVLAEKDFQTITSKFKKNTLYPDALYRLSKILQDQKKKKEAYKILNRLRKEIKDPVYRRRAEYDMGILSLEKNDYKGMRDHFLEVIELGGDSEAAKYMVGQSYFFEGNYPASIEAYGELIKTFPHGRFFYDAMAQKAKGFLKMQKDDLAIEILRKLEADTQNPHRENALYRIGEIYYNLKDFSSSISAFQILETDFPSSALLPQAYFRMGRAYYSIKAYDNAKRYFKKIVTGYSNNPLFSTCLYWVGLSGFQQKKYEQSIDWFTRVRDHKGEALIPEATFHIGDAYFNLQDYEKAAFWYGKIIEEDAHGKFAAEALYNLAICFFQIKNEQEAIKKLKELQKKYPKSILRDQAQFQIADYFYLQEKYQQAGEEFKSFLKKYPQSKDVDQALYKLGTALFQLKDYTAAQKTFKKLAKKEQSSYAPLAQYSIGKIFQKQSQCKKAIPAFQKVIDNFPPTTFRYRALFEIALCYFSSQNMDSAYVTLVMITKKENDLKDNAFLEIGKILYLKKDFEGATRSFTQCLDATTEKVAPEAFYWRGKSYLRRQLNNKAELDFLHIPMIYPKSPYVEKSYWELAQLYQNRPDYKKALEYLQKYVDVVKKEADKKKAIKQIKNIKLYKIKKP